MRPRVLGLVLALVAVGALTPAAALPGDEPPLVWVSAQPGADPATFDIQAFAEDPDGTITALRICVEEGATPDCTDAALPAPGATTAVEHCVNGDSAALGATHTFAGPGLYRITATVTAGGCPVIGSERSSVAETQALIPAPPDPIPCADPGSPVALGHGVTEDRVVIGATVDTSGHNSAAYGQASLGIQAAVNHVNASGGVCGRFLSLVIRDDGGDAARGYQYIQGLIAQDVFALVAMPSPEGLRAAILAGDIDSAQIPVVGTSGGSAAEFSSPWVWPVGTSNADYGMLEVRRAYRDGARRFGLVYDTTKTFGVETAAAVRAAVAGAEDAVLAADIGVEPGRLGYASEVAAFSSGCDPCDAVIVALDPLTARTWFGDGGPRGSMHTMMGPHLMSEGFARSCGARCFGSRAWSGVLLPAGDAGDATADYLNDLRAVSTFADPNNVFTESAYLGTMLLARAIGRAGVDLTREALRGVLDTQTFDLGLTATPLSYGAGRAASRSALAFEAVYVAGSFAGYRRDGGWETAA